jgi:hypothetical protein
MQQVVVDQPVIAHAVYRLPLYDQLELMLELLGQFQSPSSSQGSRATAA